MLDMVDLEELVRLRDQIDNINRVLDILDTEQDHHKELYLGSLKVKDLTNSFKDSLRSILKSELEYKTKEINKYQITKA